MASETELILPFHKQTCVTGSMMSVALATGPLFPGWMVHLKGAIFFLIGMTGHAKLILGTLQQTLTIR
jgi:hypothetical protein